VETSPNSVFFIDTGENSPGGLWTSDGTVAGTVPVSQIGSAVAAVTPFYFAGTDSVHGSELWRSNGTSKGTVLVKDINTHTYGSNPKYLTDANGTLYFVASTGGEFSTDYSLFKSDGTTAGTTSLTPIQLANPNNNIIESKFLAVGNSLYFTEPDGD